MSYRIPTNTYMKPKSWEYALPMRRQYGDAGVQTGADFRITSGTQSR